MAKVTSKLQLTVPKVIADQYGIRPGDELEWVAAGDAIRVIPSRPAAGRVGLGSVEERVRLFREMIRRQKRREVNPIPAESALERPPKPHELARGWKREDLYTRGRAR